MKRAILGGAASFLALSVAACIFAPGEIEPAPTTSCKTDARFFDGSCRALCASSGSCGRGEECMNIEKDVSVCLDFKHCAYLDSDTQCVGLGTYTIYTRFGMETRPYDPDPYYADPYDTTPYDDPYFEESPYGPPYASDLGCRGNATWKTIDPSSDPACGQPHDVMRCRRIGTRCKLVPGTTNDFVAP